MDGDRMKDNTLREVPLKNYFILGILLIFSLLLVYYFYLWIDAYNDTKLNKPILNKYMEVINYNELENYLVESPNAIIYVSVLENREIRNFEKKIKGLFKNNQVNKKVLYLDLTEELKDKKIKDEINDKYKIGGNSIINVPAIMVVDGGRVKEIYNIKDNNYEIYGVLNFVNTVKFSNEDGLNG